MSSEVFATTVKGDQTCISTATWFKRVGLVLLSVVIMTLLFIVPQLVQAESHTASPAAQWIVNTAIDENDGSCSDGDCSLRDAIAVATNGDNIIFAGDYTIYLNSTLTVTKRLTIDGRGHTIMVSGDTGGDGSPNVRVFYIDNTAVVTLTHLNIVSGTISGNDGGGLYNRGGTLVVQNSTFSGNGAALSGGGLYNSGGVVTVQNSTFANNAAKWGGGLFNNMGTLVVQNSTLTGNSATDSGGGLYNQSGSTTTLQNSTFSGNSAPSDGGGGLFNNSGTLHLYNTILANSPSGGDCSSTAIVTTNDHNLIEGNGATCGLANGMGGSLIGVDPLLDLLGTYGGDTPTFRLLPDSPAIDAGNNATCLAMDQRGVVRPIGPACDIGAYEAPGLIKLVTPQTQVPYHGVVTYTLVLILADPNVILTDTLPPSVVFNSWVISPANTVRVGNAITWTGALTAGQALTLTFTATHTGSYDEVITNTAFFSSAHQVGRASAAFTVVPPIVVLGNDRIIGDGDTTPSLEDGTDFGVVLTDEALTHTFTISNIDGFSLTVNSLNLSGTGVGDFSSSGLTAPVTITPNNTRTFQVRFAPILPGTQAVTVAITTTSHLGYQTVYDFALQGTGECPHQSVTNANDSGPGSLRQAIDLVCDGGTIDFAADTSINLSSTLNINKRLTIDGSGHTITVSGDTTGNGMGDVRVFSIGSSGVVALTHLSILKGLSTQGGGIYNAGTLTVQDSSVSNNWADWAGDGSRPQGGGIYNLGALTIQNSTFADNWAYTDDSYAEGGGIYNDGTLTVQNSTFADNWAYADEEGAEGGGIYNAYDSLLTVRNSTFSNNASFGMLSRGGGIYSEGTLQLYNTLIAHSPWGSDCVGSVDVNDHNLIQGSDACGLTNGAGGSLIGVDPLLSPLDDHGGAIQTFALLPGSPALDAGNNATCLATDQRGVARPLGLTCDIGAYEAARLHLTKSVTPQTHMPYHDVVTYTLALDFDQDNTSVDPNIILTDTLPPSVVFNAWVISPANTVRVGNAITWTGALTAGQALTFTFTATHVGGLHEWVTNTAYFSGTLWTGSAAVGSSVTAYLITPTAGVGGAITPSTMQAVNSGEDRAFTITPAAHYHIQDVGVDGISFGAVNVYTFTNVTADHTISATFALDEYTLAVGTNGQGQVTRTPDRPIYPHGSVVTLTAIPQAGWYFGQWLGDASGTLTQTTVLMDANKVVMATFVNTPPTYYTLTLSLIGSGLITPTAGAHTYLSGTVVPLSASPTEGWRFIGWNGNADCVDGSVTLNANKLCTAIFARYQVYLPLVLK